MATRKKTKKRKKASERRLIREKVEFFDPEAEADLEEAKRAHRLAEARNERLGTVETFAEYSEAKAALEEAEGRFEDEIWRCWIRAIPRDTYVNLMAEHPATEEQQQLLQEQLGGVLDTSNQLSNRMIRLPYNSDTFPRALLALVMEFDPPITDEELTEELSAIFDEGSTWSQSDVQTLVDTAIATCDKNTRLKR